MSVIVRASGNAGPFETIIDMGDWLDCDGAVFLKNVLGNYTISEDEGLAPVIPASTKLIADLCLKIDQEADAARLLIVGDSLRVVEYQRAEAEAKVFAAAGYTGTVPPSIVSWAEAKGWSAQDATDDILRASTAWNAALYAFRDIRLKGKEAVRNVASSSAAQTAADAAIAQINAILAQVQ